MKKSTLLLIVSILFFLLGAVLLSVALYGLMGALPREIMEASETAESIRTYEEVPPEPLIGNVHNRRALSLNGEWKALISPSQKNLLNDMMHYIERNLQPGSPSDLVEFSFENGLTLEVPGDWNTQDPRLIFYKGKVWYKTEFELSKVSGERYFLYFGAANYLAEVYLNGELVGKHRGGFTPFNFDVSDRVENGNNLLVIKVDNTITDDDIPTSSTDWLNYGGITRDVKLVRLPAGYIENYRIQLDPEDGSRISGFVRTGGRESGRRVRLEIPELGISEKLPVSDRQAAFSFPANPERWSPENPRRYAVILRYGKDELEDRIGFRTIAVRGREILLNESPVFLKGISIHEEAIGENGRASSREDAMQLLDLARELGCNFVRLAHYTHNEHMVRLADSLGLLVWAEIPVYWNINFGDETVLNMARTRMAELIDRDQNRAAVILWSLGNETPEGEARNAFFSQLNAFVKDKDPTRLTTAALIFGGEEIREAVTSYYLPSIMGKSFDTWDIELSDTLASIVDVAGVNQYFGWYYSGFMSRMLPVSTHKAREVMLDNIHRIRFHVKHGTPLIISETGAGAKKGMRADPSELAVFSEDYQALVYEKQVELVKAQEGLAGVSPWILKDFMSPIRLYQGVQDYWNLKGLVSDEGKKKKAFFVLQAFYQE